MSSNLTSFGRIIRLGGNNFWRNRWLTLGATLLMALTLMMVGVSLLISYAVKDASTSVRSKVGLTIFFREDSLPDATITSLAARIRNIPGVEEVSFTDKQRALGIFSRLKINEDIKKTITQDFNPLPRSLEIKLKDGQDLEQTVSAIERQDVSKSICSDCMSYKKNKEIVDKIIAGTMLIQKIGWLLSLFFGIIAIFNVYNIIRITIHARSDEIEIMRFVGASNWFIRGPFMTEGVICGFLGTLIASLLMISVAWGFSPYWEKSQANSFNAVFSFLGTDLTSYVFSHIGMILTVQLLVGVVLGALVSLLSVRRYLKV